MYTDVSKQAICRNYYFVCSNKLIDNSVSFVESVYQGSLPQGKTKISYEYESISKGVYYLILKWDGGLTAKKVLIVK